MGDLKTRERFTNTMNTELKRQFESLSKNTKIAMSKLLDEAVEDLLKKYDKDLISHDK